MSRPGRARRQGLQLGGGRRSQRRLFRRSIAAFRKVEDPDAAPIGQLTQGRIIGSSRFLRNDRSIRRRRGSALRPACRACRRKHRTRAQDRDGKLHLRLHSKGARRRLVRRTPLPPKRREPFCIKIWLSVFAHIIVFRLSVEDRPRARAGGSSWSGGHDDTEVVGRMPGRPNTCSRRYCFCASFIRDV